MHKNDLKRIAGKNIRRIRIARGLTQEKAAEKIGMHYKYYQKVEYGSVNLTLETIESIIKTFKVNVEEIFI